MSESLIGRVIGAYRIERELGKGGMGAVYVGRHARTGRLYAIKVLLHEHAGQKDALARFRREAEALASVGHAHIVAIHDYDETPDGLWFLAMDLLEGEDLAQRLGRTGPKPYQQAIELLDPILSAIEAAHGVGLLHRDLKPSNVFLAKIAGADAERPMLLDFGLARALDETGPHAKVTATGTVMGTPSYMSPEQAQGTQLDGRCDQWALGILLFEMLTGRVPFEGPTLTSTLVAVLTSPRPRLSDRGVAVPEALEVALDRALAKSPADRYPDVASFRSALLELTGKPRPTRPGDGFAPIAQTQHMTALPRTGAAAFAPTMATPGAMPSALPLGVPITAAPIPVPTSQSHRPSRAALWGAALGISAVVVLGTAGIASLMLLPRTTDTVTLGAPPSTDPLPSVRVLAPEAPEGSFEPALEAPTTGAPEPELTPAEPEAVGPTAPRRARAPRAHGRETTEATEAHAPPPASGPPPALVRATDLMGVGDFAGCLRELEHAGTSAPILGARMNCALRTGRATDLERTCELLHQHHPAHAYTRTCDTLMAAGH